LIGSGGQGIAPDGAPAAGTERWAPADLFGATTDPCNLYHGAAGILGVLAAALAPDLLAAAAVRHDVWQSRPVYCHGTAGSIDYLMDLAEATGEGRYAAWAREAVSAIAARAVIRDGLLLTPDHAGLDVFPGWGAGTAGVTAALLRLDGAPAGLFMPPLSPEAAPRTCDAVSH
jgi:hypothetical protein